MLSYRFRVCGKRWTAHFCNAKEFRAHGDEQTLAITITTDKEIYFRASKLHKETVIHELFHAYVEEVCITPAEPTVEQMEEVAADIMGKYGKRLLKTADKIRDAYEILSGRGNK
jgi:hypothetical protein